MVLYMSTFNRRTQEFEGLSMYTEVVTWMNVTPRLSSVVNPTDNKAKPLTEQPRHKQGSPEECDVIIAEAQYECEIL